MQPLFVHCVSTTGERKKGRCQSGGYFRNLQASAVTITEKNLSNTIVTRSMSYVDKEGKSYILIPLFKTHQRPCVVRCVGGVKSFSS